MPGRGGYRVVSLRVAILTGRLCRALMVVALCVVVVSVGTAFAMALLEQVPAFRSRKQLSAAAPAQQRLRLELSRRTVRFAADGRLLIEFSDYNADRRTYCDAQLQPVWQGNAREGKDRQAPPFELIQFAWTPRRLDTAGIAWGGVAWDRGPLPLRLGRRPMFFLEGGSQPADARRPPSFAWRYDPYGQVWKRYDSAGRGLGVLGADGFVEDRRTAVPLGAVLLGFEASDSTRAFWITTERVYRLDFAAPAAEIALEDTVLQQVSIGSHTQTAHVGCQIITAAGVHHLWLEKPRGYRCLAIHTAAGKPVFGEAGMDPQGRLHLAQVVKPRWRPALAGEDPTARCSATLYRVDADGLAEVVCRHVWELPVFQAHEAASAAVGEWPKTLLPPVLYALPPGWLRERPNLAGSGPVAESLRETARQGLASLGSARRGVTLLVSLAGLLLGVGLARRRGESWLAVTAWAPVVLALNLAGFLAWRLCAEGTTRTCALCRHRTAADRPTCRHCGGDPAPVQTLLIGSGTET